MKIKILLVISCLTVMLHVNGKNKVKFGKIDKAELEMQIYEKDTSAVAVVLYDSGESKMEYDQQNGFRLFFNRHLRLKVLKKEGVRYGDFRLYLYKGGGDEEKLTNVKALTYNLEGGKIVKDELKRSDVNSEEVNKYNIMQVFSLPNVKTGSIIEVKYTINCKSYFRNMRPWKFQKDIPVKYSEYIVTVPEYFHFRKFALGYESYKFFDEYSRSASVQLSSITRSGGTGMGKPVQSNHNYEIISYQNNIYHWIVEDMPAFEEEAYISTVDNYIQQVKFELHSVKFPNSKLKNYSQSWESINRELKTDFNFGDIFFKNYSFFKDDIDPLLELCSTQMEKVKVIFEYVRDNFKFNDRFTIYPDAVRKTYKEKNGSVADINSVLAAILSYAGIDTKPVVLSTRANGIFLYPTVTGFNYVVVRAIVDGQSILMDATEKYCGINQLPFYCLNNQGLIIGGAQPEWIDLLKVGGSQTAANSQIEIAEDGTINGKIKVYRDGYAALGFRKKVGSHVSIDKYLESYADERNNWEISNHELKRIDEMGGGVEQVIDAEMTNVAMNAGDRIYFSPIVFEPEKENPFKLKERKYPVDFGYTMNDKQICTIAIPEGFMVEEMPESVVLSMPENKAKFVFHLKKVNGNMIQVFSQVSINSPLFISEEYEGLKTLFNKIIEKHSEQIILKRI